MILYSVSEEIDPFRFDEINDAFTEVEKMLPQDPMILLSYVNTKLRDEYASLSEFCKAEDADQARLTAKLAEIGYDYDVERNRFC